MLVMEARGLSPIIVLLSVLTAAADLPPGCKQDGRSRAPGKAAAGGTGGEAGKVMCSSPESGPRLPMGALPNRTNTL